MSRKPSERSHRTEVQQELNLAPIMSILVILIPVLIFAFQFYEITVQSVAAPKLGPTKPSEDKPEDEKPPLNLTVLISEKGFVVKQQAELSGEGNEPLKLEKKRFTITPEGGGSEEVLEYDFPKLYSLVRKKKTDYPEEDTINVGADFSVPWHVVARTIDCVRVKLDKDEYADLEEYRNAEPKTKKNSFGEVEQVPLFPKVVFVVAE